MSVASIAPELGIAMIVALVVYPFAAFGLARLISKQNTSSLYFRTVCLIAGVVGCAFAVVFLLTFGFSMFTHVNVMAGIVFTMAAAATGALIGALCDRRFPDSQSSDLLAQSKE